MKYVWPTDARDHYYLQTGSMKESGIITKSYSDEIAATQYFIHALKRRGLIKEYSKVRSDKNTTCMYHFKHLVERFYSELSSHPDLPGFVSVGRISQAAACKAAQASYLDVKRPNDRDYNADGWYNYVGLFRLDPKGKYEFQDLGVAIAREVIGDFEYIYPLMKGIESGGLRWSHSGQSFYEPVA